MFRLICPTLLMLMLGGCAWLPTKDSKPLEPTAWEERATAFTNELMLAPESDSDIQQRCDAADALILEIHDQISSRSTTPGLVDLRDYDALQRVFMAVAQGEASLIAQTSPDLTLRTAAIMCRQKLAQTAAKLSLSLPLVNRLKAIDPAVLNADEKNALNKALLEFRRSGVERSSADRERIQELHGELAALSAQWAKNLRESPARLSLSSSEQLRGLPDDYINTRRRDAQGNISITTAYPDVLPILSYADDADLRRDVLRMFRNRAHPKNEPVLRNMVEKRYEFAQLLGYENWADFALEDKMSGHPDRAKMFLQQLESAARQGAEQEYRKLLEYQESGSHRIPVWSDHYLKEKLKRSEYALDSKEVRSYFAYENVRAGIIDLVEEMFGVEVRDWQDAPIWHESVTAHALYENDRLLGRFFLDMHPREGKFSHAAAFPIRMGPQSSGIPVAALVCNFPSGGHDTGLMEHRQVETFLHEFGHLLHMLFSSHPNFQTLAMHGLEWDFIEAPSQLLQEWVWDYESLARFAVNSAGNVIPRALVEKMNRARQIGIGLDTLRQLHLASISLAYYDRPPEEVDFKEIWDEMEARYSLFEPLPSTYPYTAFTHLDSYSAYYYTYQWSLAIATDLFSRFKVEGLNNETVAKHYRESVLAPGASRPAAVSIRDFLGRDWSIDAYEALIKRVKH